MKTIFYGITIVFLKLFSLIPLSVLYVFSRFLAFFLTYIFRYRKKIIWENLSKSFPEKTSAEITELQNSFYHYFAIMIAESIKMFSMNLETLEKHIKFTNPEILQKYYKENKSIVVISAHYGNWEWLLGLRNSIPHHAIAVYKSLNNKYFNRKMVNLRSRFKGQLINMREVPKVLMELKSKAVPSLTVFIADQSPVWEEIQYWTLFLNQNTPVYLGPEKLAKKLDMVVVYFRMKVVSKGNYEVEIVPISEDPKSVEDHIITDKHVKMLEEDIINAPEYWLWSHRRWKLTRKREEEEKIGRFRFSGAYKRKENNV